MASNLLIPLFSLPPSRYKSRNQGIRFKKDIAQVFVADIFPSLYLKYKKTVYGCIQVGDMP